MDESDALNTELISESIPFPTSRMREVVFSDEPVIALVYAVSGVLLESAARFRAALLEHWLVDGGQCRPGSPGIAIIISELTPL
jgi:hypothetical protein